MKSNIKKIEALSEKELQSIFGGSDRGRTDGIDTTSENTSGGTTTDTYETTPSEDGLRN
ncbi:MAG: hypothetical protein K0B10_15470 [Vicingaceae bacterium]|nr:hypothetical protein [Vicingaceae bacterium]